MQLIQFYLAIFLVFFLPGYFLLRAIFAKDYHQLASLEKLLITFVFSLAITDGIMLLINYLHIAIIRKNLFLGIIGVSFVLAGISFIIKIKSLNHSKFISNFKFQISNLATPSYRQILLFITLLGLSIFLRSIYISDSIFPKTTDFGHHIYWANYISINQELPTYDEKFIIGEHLPFAAINILSGVSYISPLAVIILFLFNIFTLIAVFVLTYWLAVPFNKAFQKIFPKIKKISAYDIALWGLFIIGILYPISAPQVKFVSGGVIGNIIGNLLIITAIYAFTKAIFSKSTSFISLFLISIVTLVYTHHLSSFIFIYSFVTILISFIILTLIFTKFNLLKFFKLVFQYLKPFFYPLPLLVIIIGLFFLFQVRVPSYLNSEAIDVAVGTPTKITRVGFGLTNILERVGSWRVLFTGIFGVIILPLFWKILQSTYLKKSAKDKNRHILLSNNFLVSFALSLVILLAWSKILFLMSWKPGLLKVDIPSRRIITYLTYPLSIMASFGFAYFFAVIQTKLSKQLVTFLFIFFIGIGIISGFGQDITANQRTTAGKFEVSDEVNSREVMQTYLAAIYLAANTSTNEMVLKDHKFLKGDTWMKLFFMRDYKYPLSRTYDRRYEDTINKRETCTRDMVLKPNSEIGQQCFAETNTHYIVLKKGHDDAVFKKSPNFQQVYSSKTVTVFQKH
jgi:hypothetical protein